MKTLSLDLRGVEATHALPETAPARGASVSLLVHSVALSTLVLMPLLQSTNLPEVARAVAPPLPRAILVTLPPAQRPATAVRRAPKAGRPAQSAAVFPSAPKDTPSTLNLAPAFDPSLDPHQNVGVDEPTGETGDGCPLGSLCGPAMAPVTNQAPSMVVIGGSIREPKLRESRPPVYPPLAQAARAEGKVVLEAHVGVDGRVIEVRITESHRLFDEAALASVRSRRYDPLLLNGVATEFLVTITVTFNVRR